MTFRLRLSHVHCKKCAGLFVSVLGIESKRGKHYKERISLFIVTFSFLIVHPAFIFNCLNLNFFFFIFEPQLMTILVANFGLTMYESYEHLFISFFIYRMGMVIPTAHRVIKNGK